MNDLLYAFEYCQKGMPTKVDNLTFDSMHDLSRPYQITATMCPSTVAARREIDPAGDILLVLEATM